MLGEEKEKAQDSCNCGFLPDLAAGRRAGLHARVDFNCPGGFLKTAPATEAQHTRWTIADRACLFLLQLYGVVVLAALALVPSRFLPAEDAVILFEYTRNLAQHGAITFLSGGPHVEGATDFGWMALIALAIRCGIAPFWFCAAANVVCLAVLALLLTRIAQMRIPVRFSVRTSIPRILAVAGAAGLCRQIFAAASGFSVLLCAVLLTALVLCVLRRRPAAAALTALVFCLVRPDSVVIAVPLLLSLLLRKPTARQSVLPLLSLFVLPGILYFLWRWHYFGELFPLPFLVKSDFRRELGFLALGSVRASLVPLLFTAILLAPLAWLGRRATLWLTLPLIVVPTLFYWVMRLDQNVGARFFYYLPVATAILLAVHWPALAQKRVLVFRTALCTWFVLLAAAQYRELLTFRYLQFGNVKGIAEALARMPTHGVILTSEAGFLPYYSGWTTYDTWGLDTPEFAHHFFQVPDVERIHPDLIATHPDRTESCIVQPWWQPDYADRAWPYMTRNLVRGASPQQYELWLTPYGSPFYQWRKGWQPGAGDRECWLVRKDSPLRDGIEAALKEHGAIQPAQALRLEQSRSGLATR